MSQATLIDLCFYTESDFRAFLLGNPWTKDAPQKSDVSGYHILFYTTGAPAFARKGTTKIKSKSGRVVAEWCPLLSDAKDSLLPAKN